MVYILEAFGGLSVISPKFYIICLSFHIHVDILLVSLIRNDNINFFKMLNMQFWYCTNYFPFFFKNIYLFIAWNEGKFFSYFFFPVCPLPPDPPPSPHTLW